MSSGGNKGRSAVWGSTEALRKHIVQRLHQGHLFSAEECVLVIKHMMRLFAQDAATDFENLLCLDDMYRRALQTYCPHALGVRESSPELLERQRRALLTPEEDTLMKNGLAAIWTDLESAFNYTRDFKTNVRLKLEQLLVAIHKSMLELISIDHVQRRSRMIVMKNIVKGLEELGAYGFVSKAGVVFSPTQSGIGVAPSMRPRKELRLS